MLFTKLFKNNQLILSLSISLSLNIKNINNNVLRKYISTSIVLNDSNNKLIIPTDKLDFSYARASGPGGQNVNKLNTKAELRFNVALADWIPPDVKLRLEANEFNRINKDGDLIITSQEQRFKLFILSYFILFI